MSICERMEAPRGGSALGKRKEREYPSEQQQQQRAPPLLPAAAPAKPELPRPAAHLARFVKPPLPPLPKAPSSAKLMAGYLAHEFLKFGTLRGHQPEPTRKVPAAARTAATPSPSTSTSSSPAAAPEPRARYTEASLLLMVGGARVPGVVNPSQLGRWLRIKE